MYKRQLLFHSKHWKNTFFEWENKIPFLGSLSFKEYAKESIVGTGIIGSPFEKAIPLLNPKPILKPVKEPGPILTAIASISLTVLFDLSKTFLTKPVIKMGLDLFYKDIKLKRRNSVGFENKIKQTVIIEPKKTQFFNKTNYKKIVDSSLVRL